MYLSVRLSVTIVVTVQLMYVSIACIEVEKVQEEGKTRRRKMKSLCSILPYGADVFGMTWILDR